MRIFMGVVAGFCLASVLILAGEWGYTIAASPGLQAEHTPFALLVVLLSLLYLAIALTMGGYLSAIIADSPEAVAGYSVFQLFFGVWFFRDFWTTGFIWYRPAALFLVIPCAMLGRYLSMRTRRGHVLPSPASHPTGNR